YGDGSVIGTIQFRGAGPVRTVWLPAGTLRDRGGGGGASLQGMAVGAWFSVGKVGGGRLPGPWVGVCFCGFTPPLNVARLGRHPHAPLSLEAAEAGAN